MGEARRREVRTARALLLLWTAAAIAFAFRRAPYDDERFSITLARDAGVRTFWRWLTGDYHPPWVALFDRLLVPLCHDARAINVARALASACAIALVGELAPRLGARRWMVVLAAFHPIVFMYGAAARWYPIAFLAESLRAWALWAGGEGEEISTRKRSAAFAL